MDDNLIEENPMTLAQKFYDAYNAGGDPATANKNYRGEPCPAWADLPENIRAKWSAVTELALDELAGRSRIDFGAAIALLRAGRRVRRAGWNGKGMWLALTPGATIEPGLARAGAADLLVKAESPSSVVIGSHIDMRAADGTLVNGKGGVRVAEADLFNTAEAAMAWCDGQLAADGVLLCPALEGA